MSSPSQAGTLFIIGSVNVDVILGVLDALPQRGTEMMMSTSETRVGGNAANTALAYIALGGPHRVVANIGADMFGQWVASAFPESAALWPRSTRPTTLSIGLSHSDGERSFLTTEGHLATFCLQDVIAQLPPRAEPGDIALLCSPFLSPLLLAQFDRLIQLLRGRGFDIALDTGWPPEGWTDDIKSKVAAWLGGTHHVLMNEIETLTFAGCDSLDKAASSMRTLLAPDAVMVVKRGSQGAMAWRGEECVTIPAPAVAVIDTIGAGDIFNAGYLYAFRQGADLRRCLELGIETASEAISTLPRYYGRKTQNSERGAQA